MLEITQTTQDIPYQNISNNTSTSGIIDSIIIFLKRHLPDFPNQNKIIKNYNENNITDELRQYLQHKRRWNQEKKEYPFEFEREGIQKPKGNKGYSKYVDIVVNLYVEDNACERIYCIEAKKLPTGPNEREREYISGKKGGIQRFKTNDHGKDRERNLLERNGMFGYIMENNFDFWHTTINEWIRGEPNWEESEQLEKLDFSKIATLKSQHTRITGKKLYLTHFWINVS